MRAISAPALALLLIASACSGTSEPDYPYPDTISGYFAEEKLFKATQWFTDATSAAVYIRQGDRMPDAALQIGIMVSYDKTTPAALAEWIEGQARLTEQRLYNDDTPNEACTVSRARNRRLYIAIHACKADADRAVCVQLDETLTEKQIASCSSGACLKRDCERMWANWGEEVDWLAADVLERR